MFHAEAPEAQRRRNHRDTGAGRSREEMFKAQGRKELINEKALRIRGAFVLQTVPSPLSF